MVLMIRYYLIIFILLVVVGAVSFLLGVRTTEKPDLHTNGIPEVVGLATSTQGFSFSEVLEKREVFDASNEPLISSEGFRALLKETENNEFSANFGGPTNFSVYVVSTQLEEPYQDPECEYGCRPTNIRTLDYYKELCEPEGLKKGVCDSVYKKIYSREDDFANTRSFTRLQLPGYEHVSTIPQEGVAFIELETRGYCCAGDYVDTTRVIEYNPKTGVTTVRTLGAYTP